MITKQGGGDGHHPRRTTMTVGELKALLANLPDDMKIQVLDESEAPVDIVQLSRGSWGYPVEIDTSGLHDDDIAEEYWEADEEFRQDDENGKIAVLVTW
jgi:hypothetical protein